MGIETFLPNSFIGPKRESSKTVDISDNNLGDNINYDKGRKSPSMYKGDHFFGGY